MNESILEQIAAGKKVLFRAFSAENRGDIMRQAFGRLGGRPYLKFYPATHMIKHESGGLVHYVIHDDEVRGYEYHVGYDPTPEMTTRIRL